MCYWTNAWITVCGSLIQGIKQYIDDYMTIDQSIIQTAPFMVQQHLARYLVTYVITMVWIPRRQTMSPLLPGPKIAGKKTAQIPNTYSQKPCGDIHLRPSKLQYGNSTLKYTKANKYDQTLITKIHVTELSDDFIFLGHRRRTLRRTTTRASSLSDFFMLCELDATG
jgi:hypothetical protein